MNKFTIIIIALVLLISCNSKQSNPETKSKPAGLRMNKITMVERKRADSVFIFNGEDLDIRFHSARNGSYYLARYDVKSSKDQPGSMEQVIISDSLGKAMKFADTTSFLNYISQHGYEKVAAKSRKYGFIYTLKRSK